VSTRVLRLPLHVSRDPRLGLAKRITTNVALKKRNLRTKCSCARARELIVSTSSTAENQEQTSKANCDFDTRLNSRTIESTDVEISWKKSERTIVHVNELAVFGIFPVVNSARTRVSDVRPY